MPLPTAIVPLPAPYQGTGVYFQGIVHCILDGITPTQANALVRPLCHALKADACGILLLNDTQTGFKPLVYVKETDTAIWESGCGSGTAAVGCYLATLQQTSCSVTLTQDGGILSSQVTMDCGTISHVSISGYVSVVHGNRNLVL